MTERTKTNPQHWATLGALCVVALGAAVGGCAREDRYCDSTGCYYCDGVGCRLATPPSRPPCRGDYECSTGQICTNVGCVTNCRTLADCPAGWMCRGGSGGDSGASTGVCVAPREPDPTPNPGSCRTNADCGNGTICIDGTCRAVMTMPGCTSDSSCPSGNVCLSGRCTPSSNTCQFDNQCGMGRVCVNSECRQSCGGAAACPAGQVCTTTGSVMYCAPSTTPMCVHDAECGASQRCVNGTCYRQCGAGTSCDSTSLYCSDDGLCVPDTRPRPFCDASRPCGAGSVCINGLCRVPCTTNNQCQMVDVTYRNCGHIPSLPASDTRQFCLTDNEFRPLCARQADCAMGQSCIDGTCR